MKTGVRILPPVGKHSRFSSPQLLRIKSNRFYQFVFTPAEVDATKRYQIIVRSCDIQARLIAMQYQLAAGTLLISLTPKEFIFEAEFHPWNNEAFEILSTAVDELTTRLLCFRALYPAERLIAHMTMDPEPCAPT